MKKSFLTILSVILFLTTPLLSQYTVNDSALVHTTFQREFNGKIIYDYLFSQDSVKVNAALLSISHSNDTTFIDSVIKLDFSKHGEMIAFTLGQIGESEKSTKYLFNILTSDSNKHMDASYNAIGKCGDSLALANLFAAIEDSLITPKSFPLAIVSFNIRGIKNVNSINYLANYLNQNPDDDELFNILFALYRLGSNKSIIPNLQSILSSEKSVAVKLYALNNFKKIKFFPNDIELFNKLATSNSWEVKTEFANSACYYPFTSNNEIATYISLIEDSNPNVARSAAKSIRHIKYSHDTNWLKGEIENLLVNSSISKNTKGELLISYIKLFNSNIEETIDKYADFIGQKYIYRILENNTSDWEFNYDYLSNRIEDANEIELLDLLPAYLALQNKYLNEKEYAAYLFKVFQSNKPSSVSIIADGLKTPMIHHYRELLQELLLQQVFNNKNNPQFAETIISLASLAYKVDRVFYDSIIDMLTTSQLYSVKKYAFAKQGVPYNTPKDDSLFNKLWSNSFKYKFADIGTNKGSFTIKLNPSYAPTTCGNFISLTTKGFYDGVTFHRVVPNFVIQTGDTSGTGWGGPEYEIVSEFSPLPFNRAAVGIASIGKDTEGSQWFVMHSSFPHLNGRYTNWANVISWMDVVDIIDEGDRIIKIKLR